jgi:DNA ligase D-like protein (predicted 3'-phosphoesterase)
MAGSCRISHDEGRDLSRSWFIMKKSLYVIQKHKGRALHYDFRLEMNGVLKSWAVPKGPSTDPRENRLAMETEDHAMEHADFEGTIPGGEYGAGAVIVWDRGTYRNLREGEGVSMEASCAQGKIDIELEGEKLNGGFALIRTGAGKWLLKKKKDAWAEPHHNPVTERPASVLSGRTIEELISTAGE